MSDSDQAGEGADRATEGAGPGTGTGGPSPSDTACTRTVMVDGEVVRVGPGWNDLPDGTRLYLRKDGTWSRSGRRAANAMDAVGRAGDQGSSGGLTPIAPGHTVTLRHGAWSQRVVSPVAAELIEETLAAAPFLSQPSFRPALEAWARAEARCLLLGAWLDEHGLLDERGEPRGATALMTQQENLALKHRTRLGLDAASRAGIEASLTSSAVGLAGLEAALDRGAELLRQRMAGGGASTGAPQVVTGESWGPPAPGQGESQPGPARGAQAEAGEGS